MKKMFLIKLIAAIALFWILPFGASAVPTYICEVRNDVQVSPTEYQFEVWLVRTGAENFEFAGMQLGFRFNNNIIAPGAILTLVPGAYTINACNANKAANCSITSYGNPTSKGIKITLGTPTCGAGNGTIISNTGQGHLVGTFKIVSSLPFVPNTQANLTWWFGTPQPWPTKVFYYTTSSLDCTAPVNHLLTNLTNPILNPPTGPTVFDVTGGGTVCSPATSTINLSGSQLTFDYQLLLDGNPVGAPLPGTGSPLSWTVGDAGIYTVTAGTTAMNGSALLIVNPGTTNHINVTACDTYTWAMDGMTYTASGDYTYTVGCDVYILHLIIVPSTTDEVTISACDTYTWPLNGMTYTASGDYTNAAGAPTCVTTTLHLTITPSSTVEVTESACDTYTWALNGQTYTVSGDYTYVDGCVTNILHLTITPSSTVEVTESACDTYTWALNGQTYTVSGDYTYVDGCVTNILHLTITPSSTVEVTESACDTYTWALNGQTYTVSGDYTYVDGCVTNILHLTITPSSTVEVTEAACDTYTWALNGQTYTMSGDYTYVDGCVTNILHLTITPSSTVEVTESACDTYTWALNGQTYTASGDYTYVDGCVTNILHLTITPSSIVEFWETACDFFIVPVLNITLTTSGDYPFVDGCTTYILHLTIVPSTTVEFTASACDTYTWAIDGQTYTASGDYTFVDGCVTNILHLTITPSTTVEFSASTCDTYTWALNGQTYTASGDYTYVDGCVTNILHLTISQTVVPLFPFVYGPYSLGDNNPAVLPLVSNNGVTGTWNPAVINTSALGSFIYTFTPDAGQCGTVITRTITINPVVPTFIFSQDIGTTLQVAWPQVPGAYYYYIGYSLSPNGPWINKNSLGGTVAKITGLTQGTPYYWKAEAYNAAGYKISTSAVETHTTESLNLDVTQDVGKTCLLGWNDYSTWASSYVLQYRIGAGAWTQATSTINELKLNNLTPLPTTYNARVAVFKAGVLWGYTGIGTFNTNPVTFTPTNITSTGLTLTWNNLADDLASWVTYSVVYYRPQGSTDPWAYKAIHSSANTAALTGLTAATTYDCYVIPYYQTPYVVWGPTNNGTFTTAGAKQSNSNSEVSVYPNPFVNEIHVALFAETETDVNWNIYDMTGKLILSGSESVSSGYSTLNIEAANLPKGVYMLNAMINDEMQSFRIIK